MTHSPNTPWRRENVVLPKHDVLYNKPSEQSTWDNRVGKGGNSRYTDEDGVPLKVPTIVCWRPFGWPALDLSYVRRCGQPDEEKLAETRQANTRVFDRALTDELGELVDRSSLGTEGARALRARGRTMIEDLPIPEYLP
jgi:hypothetical protein